MSSDLPCHLWCLPSTSSAALSLPVFTNYGTMSQSNNDDLNANKLKNIIHVSHGPPMVGFVLLNSSDCFPNHGLTDNRQLAKLCCFPSGQSVANWPEKDCDWPGHILI
ncbi:hypothetical protein B0H14DRAFT_2567891 [Mycena olivaceomarginata]|nr:hypothetical protein B0H14DRAFT_2567891 [Mycena olivaceomarginata]